MDVDVEAKWRGAGRPDKCAVSSMLSTLCSLFLFTPSIHPSPTDPSSSEQFHVVTVSDSGRNWSDQEVRALIQVWSDERVCRQLESSTRKRDIFIQISTRLMQQGIERDWKQCHTKYKNLKYLYRSLQRGKTDEADPRRLMRFYDEVDAIMNRTTHGSPADHRGDSGGHSVLESCEENDHGDVYLTQPNTAMTLPGAMEERTCSSDSVSSKSLAVTPKNDEQRLHTDNSHCSERKHRLISETNIIVYSYLASSMKMIPHKGAKIYSSQIRSNDYEKTIQVSRYSLVL